MPSKRFIVSRNNLPENFPTHKHDSKFWECLGRAIATFGFLEECLRKAIFSYTGNRPYTEEEISAAYQEWLPTLEKTLSDPLGGLINDYSAAVTHHPDENVENFGDLIDDLRKASHLRNVLCHGSWRLPDEAGRSEVFFVNKKLEKFESLIDAQFLVQTRKHTVGLACSVINTVTIMGWLWPGSDSPAIDRAQVKR